MSISVSQLVYWGDHLAVPCCTAHRYTHTHTHTCTTLPKLFPLSVESGELSSHEESSDNETAPESPLAENPISQPNAQTSRVTPVLAPVVLSKVSSPQPPPAPPTNSVGRPQVTTSKVAPRNKPTQPEKPKSAQQGDQFTVKESVSQSTDYEGPTREYMTAGPPPYRHYKVSQVLLVGQLVRVLNQTRKGLVNSRCYSELFSSMIFTNFHQ